MNLSPYAKAAISVSGGIVAWGTATVGLLEMVPDRRAAAVGSVLLLVVHVAQSFGVWLTRNEPTIGGDIKALEDAASAITGHQSAGSAATSNGAVS